MGNVSGVVDGDIGFPEDELGCVFREAKERKGEVAFVEDRLIDS